MIASENCHWYDKNGNPVYEVPYADPRKGMRPTTLADARKLNLVPGYTEIASMEAKPGLIAWKLEQVVNAALTLPRIEGETLDAYKVRVLTDAEEQSVKARDRGTELHAAVELYILGKPFDPRFGKHIVNIENTLKQQCGLDLLPADAETTFATPDYGGKIDWRQGTCLADFKTKDKIENGKRLWYDNHLQQLSAYYKGSMPDAEFKDARLISIFVGVDDEQVRIFEWPVDEIERCYQMFTCLLRFWMLKNRYGSFSKD